MNRQYFAMVDSHGYIFIRVNHLLCFSNGEVVSPYDYPTLIITTACLTGFCIWIRSNPPLASGCDDCLCAVCQKKAFSLMIMINYPQSQPLWNSTMMITITISTMMITITNLHLNLVPTIPSRHPWRQLSRLHLAELPRARWRRWCAGLVLNGDDLLQETRGGPKFAPGGA